MINHYDGGDKMSETYSGFGLGDAVVNAAMSNGFNRGGGGGSWNGGNGIVAAPFAGLGSIQHGIGHVEQCVRGGNENAIREASFNHQNDMINSQAHQTSQNMLQLTRDMGDADRATQKGFADVMLEFCKCCKDSEIATIKEGCATRELIVAENSKTRELIQSVELQKAVDKNNIAATVEGINSAAAANTQAIINAINQSGQSSHHGHHGH